jgi:putative hydrolase of the HAD superfamily
MARLTTIGFDADDTLWQNEEFYRLTEAQFAALLADHASEETISSELMKINLRNLEFYGFGIKSFTLSMIETALTITGGNVPTRVISEILAAGRELMTHPVEPLPHAVSALEAVRDTYRIVLVTKGDLLDQERKLAQSGLGDYFDGVEIVSTKTVETYHAVFARHGDGPEHGMMVGNSLKSDVVPAIEAGAWGVFVPHNLTWAAEHADAPSDHPRFHEIPHLGDLPPLIDRLR